MTKEIPPINILLICDNETDIEKIKQNLNAQMRLPWKLTHCINIKEASSRAHKADIIILDLGLKGPESSKHIFETVQHISFEIPIIALTGKKKHGLSTYVMEKGAADTLIRGQFARLVDAIEFALIRQKITTGTRKTSDKTLQDSKDAGEAKYQHSCDDRLKDQEESKNTLSMFMGGYSASDHGSKDKKETK